MITKWINKIIVYALVTAGAIVFIMPLLWMISTSLKPLEQTMSLPPTWIPKGYFADIDGERTPVKKGEIIEVPSFVIFDSTIDRKRVVSSDRLVDGQLLARGTDGSEVRTPVRVLEDVPASASDPWMKVIPELVQGSQETDVDWVVVPASTLSETISPRWGNYIGAVREMKQFPNYLKNTLILCFMTVVGVVFSSAIAAYGFSRIPWRGRNKLFVIALSTMMIPFPVVMVPMYCLFKYFGWLGTLKPLWVPAFFAPAFNIFLLRQFFMGIPKDLSDAARIDGCSEFRIFWQIILPLCRPALMVVGLFTFMGTWNDFLGPLIYLTDEKDFTLALGLQAFQSQLGGTPWNYLMAASVLIVLPVIVLFFFTQKSFIEGISMTGTKG